MSLKGDFHTFCALHFVEKKNSNYMKNAFVVSNDYFEQIPKQR